MKPFEEVLAAGGALVAAWDRHDDERTRLCLFSVGAAGAAMAAETRVPRDQREAMVERLLGQGLRVGGSYGTSLFAWVADARGVAVWSDAGAWQLAPGARVAGVTVFYGERDVGHRGVRAGDAIIAEETDPSPGLDPTYGADELEADTRWARALGEDLAVWFHCPLTDPIYPTDIARELAIARALPALADEIAGSSSATAAIVKSLGPIGVAPDLALRCTADALAIVVGDATAVLARGTRAQIAAFLRRMGTPLTVLWTMNELLAKRR